MWEKLKGKQKKMHKGKMHIAEAEYIPSSLQLNRDLPTTNFKSVNKKEVK